MSSLVSGIIHQIEDGIVKTGHFTGSAYKTIILTTGNKLTCFDLDFITGIEIGKEYTFPVEQKGSYTNIVGTVTPVIQTEGVTPIHSAVTESPDSGTPDPSDHALEIKPIPAFTSTKDTAIRKAVALKAAVEFLVGLHTALPEKFSVGDVIETAKKFEEYLK